LRLLQSPAHHGCEAVEVILRVLPRHMRVFGIEQDAHLTARVIEHGGADFSAVVEVNEEGAARVRAVVDAEGVAFHANGKWNKQANG